MPKVNPFLAQFEAKLQAQYLGRLERFKEFALAGSLISANETLQVGPGRASKFLEGQIKSMNEIADMVMTDDGDLAYSKIQMATRMKEILGPEAWVKYRPLFPFLKEFW